MRRPIHSLAFSIAVAVAAYVPAARALGFGIGEARAVGMGGAYVALATGIHAPRWNPANLAGLVGPDLEIGLADAGILAGSDGLTIGDWRRWAADGSIASAEIRESLDRFPGDAARILGTFETNLVAVAADKIAFTAGAVEIADWTVPRGAVDAFTDPREPEEALRDGVAPRDLAGMSGNAWTLGFAGLSAARLVDLEAFDRFAVGATVTFLTSGPRIAVTESSGRVSPAGDAWDTDGRFVLELSGATIRRRTAGDGDRRMNLKLAGTPAWGVGADIGVSGIWRERTAFGVAIRNLTLRPVRWTDGERRTYILDGRTGTIDLRALIDDRPEGRDALDHLDSLFAPAGSDVERIERLGPHEARLPVSVRGGIAREIGGWLTWAVDAEQGFDESAISSRTPRVATGIELRPLGGWLPIRAGMSIGGPAGHYATLGAGLHVGAFHVDAAVLNRGALTPVAVPLIDRAVGFGAAIEMKLSF